MKSIGASLNASGADFSQWCDLIPDDNVVFEVCQILFATEYNANATFLIRRPSAWTDVTDNFAIFIKFNVGDNEYTVDDDDLDGIGGDFHPGMGGSGQGGPGVQCQQQ